MRRDAFFDYYLSADGRRFLVEQSALLAAAAAVLLAVFGGSDLDLAVTRLFFDAERGTFPGTNDWWLKTVLHDDARTAAALALLASIAATAAAWWLPRLARLRETRHALTFITATAVAAAMTVAAAKHWSGHACPWDIANFGGIAPYRHLFEPHAALSPVRGCFPAAHPLVGFGWLGVCFALRPLTRRWAKLSALIVLIVGTALGFVQMARGAHFLSHVLWTAWTVWAVNLTLLWACRRLGPRSAHKSHDPEDRTPVRLAGAQSAAVSAPAKLEKKTADIPLVFAVFGLVAIAALRPRHGLAELSTFLIGVWPLLGLVVWPQLDAARSGRLIMERAYLALPPLAELGLVAQKETLLLHARGPATNFGHRRVDQDQERFDAARWLAADARRYLIIRADARDPCFLRGPARSLGFAHSIEWQLVAHSAADPKCAAKGHAQRAIPYRAPAANARR